MQRARCFAPGEVAVGTRHDSAYDNLNKWLYIKVVIRQVAIVRNDHHAGVRPVHRVREAKVLRSLSRQDMPLPPATLAGPLRRRGLQHGASSGLVERRRSDI
ncbi:hypothetical protein THICB2_330010 [Thiomonas sp. CB2]|nr:hypothetical protein THICB2_330010 [Thiomonas sp. CB2]